MTNVRIFLVTLACVIFLSFAADVSSAKSDISIDVDLSDSNAAEVLAKAIRDGNAKIDRRDAVIRLISLGVRAQMHVDTLIKVLRSDPDRSLRGVVALGLPKVLTDAKIGVPILVEALKDDVVYQISRCSRGRSVADDAASAIASYGQSAKFAVPMIQKLRTSPIDLQGALGAIDPMQFPFSAPQQQAALPLANVLSNGETELRRQAIDYLNRLDDFALPALPVVEKALGDSDAYVRIQSAVLLLRRGEHEQAAGVIVAATQGADLAIRLRGLRQLGALGDRVPQGHVVLQQALTDTSSEVRKTAVLTLNTIPVLVAALDDSSPDVRDSAVKRLARLGKSAMPAVDRLRMIVQDDETVLRVEAAIALQKITGQVDSWSTFVEALNGDDYRTKVRALYGMRKFSPAELATVGDVLLASDEKSLPHLAAQTLAVMKDQAEPWLPQLRELTKHPSSRVSKAAKRIVRNLEGTKQSVG
jgi:HEAT repeat protein